MHISVSPLFAFYAFQRLQKSILHTKIGLERYHNLYQQFSGSKVIPFRKSSKSGNNGKRCWYMSNTEVYLYPIYITLNNSSRFIPMKEYSCTYCCVHACFVSTIQQIPHIWHVEARMFLINDRHYRYPRAKSHHRRPEYTNISILRNHRIL